MSGAPMSTVNEFALNLPITSPGMEVSATQAVAGYSPVDVTAGYSLPADIDNTAVDHISVSVDGANVINYDPSQPMVLVDMVLTVTVQNPTTAGMSSYRMVKRLSLDKLKLACDAEHMTPVQVVEEDDPLEVAQIMEQFYVAKRAREIAGLNESAGSKTFEVVFHFDGEVDGEMTTLSPSFLKVNEAKDKAHARHMFEVKHAHKYPNVKIIRVTEVK